MPDSVLLPPTTPRADGLKPGGWWSRQGEKILCELCPRECLLRDNDRGFCFVRQNVGNEMVLTTYGKSTGFCIDPIEKKPLNHFLPGTPVLSFGTAGCNLGCKFCQNWSISKSREIENLSEHASPDAIAQAALATGCRSVAFTYNDPVIWAEYAIDAAAACHEHGIKTVAVTAGYVSDIARKPVFECFDAANVDLKAFTELFYKHLALSQLQPVLDTLVWLKHETDIWFEITNLLIPDENDSPDELKRMCDWILEHIGDNVPVHFTAFHPDFRMQDTPRTPHETLIAAREIALETGLKYAYVGNVNDTPRQSTYCPNCSKLLIERNWHDLGAYNLDNGNCRFCDTTIDGLFESQPGDWGRKRQPLDMTRFALPIVTPETHDDLGQIDTVFTQGINSMSDPDSESPETFAPDATQQQAIVHAAARAVTAAVLDQPLDWTDATLAGTASEILSGAFVSLKRSGQLRSCMGMQGQSIRLDEAIKRAAHNAARKDPRFPPISPNELDQLDLEVWLLHGPQEVAETGETRIEQVTIGRHGLQVIAGEKRGLLLPGVATDHGWDAETFLDQVCIKAGLPPTAWRDDDTRLFTFDGDCLSGRIADTAATAATTHSTTIATPRHSLDQDQVAACAEFCNTNIQALLTGKVASPYLPGVPDGDVQGLVLQSNWMGHATPVVQGRLALNSGMPLQSSLFELSEAIVTRLRTQIGPRQVQGLSTQLLVLSDTAMHGTTDAIELGGADRGDRAIVVTAADRFAVHWDKSDTPEQLTARCQADVNLPPGAVGRVYSLHGVGTDSAFTMNRVPRAVASNGTRQAGVAGKFYPDNPLALDQQVKDCFSNAAQLQATSPTTRNWPAAMLPHAGLKFSGAVAAQTLASIDIPNSVIIIGPKHTRHGVPWAVSPHHSWQLPGGEMAADPELARQLADAIPGLELDSEAHREEHAIEVELPLLRHLAPKTKVTGIVIGSGDLESCRDFAKHLTAVLDQLDKPPLLLISSDMNHFASDSENRRLDEAALAAIETLEPHTLLQTVRDLNISMCGVLPAVIVMETLKQRGTLSRCHRTGYATSAETTGDSARVVGYAGILLG